MQNNFNHSVWWFTSAFVNSSVLHSWNPIMCTQTTVMQCNAMQTEFWLIVMGSAGLAVSPSILITIPSVCESLLFPLTSGLGVWPCQMPDKSRLPDVIRSKIPSFTELWEVDVGMEGHADRNPVFKKILALGGEWPDIADILFRLLPFLFWFSA